MNYQYKCKKCGHCFDVECPMSEHTDTKPCEKCGTDAPQHFPSDYNPKVVINTLAKSAITWEKE